MNQILYTIFSNQDYIKVIRFILLLSILFLIMNEPSNIILNLFSNQYYIILYLSFVFYISLYNQSIGFLLALIFAMMLDKLYIFKLSVEKKNRDIEPYN